MGHSTNKAKADTIFLAIDGGVAPMAFRRLIADGADANVPGPDGSRPLHLAARAGNAALCSLLIRAGADPSLPDASGALPIDVAAGPKTRLALLGGGQGGGDFLTANPADRPALRRALLQAFDSLPDEALAGVVEGARAASANNKREEEK